MCRNKEYWRKHKSTKKGDSKAINDAKSKVMRVETKCRREG